MATISTSGNFGVPIFRRRRKQLPEGFNRLRPDIVCPRSALKSLHGGKKLWRARTLLTLGGDSLCQKLVIKNAVTDGEADGQGQSGWRAQHPGQPD
jgi:hypothetical protein